MLHKVLFKKLHPEARIPEYQTPGSSGADVYAVDFMLLEPGQVGVAPLGFSVAIPEGYEIQMRPRSGLAFKNGITLLNSPGTIDADYRQEVKAIMINLGKQNFRVEPGMRIAQIVLCPVERAVFSEIEGDLPTTSRWGGFGSTGV